MGDPFSTAAAVISLVDIAIKAAKEINSLISAMRSAPEEIISIHGQVAQFESLMRQLQNLELAYSGSAQNQNAFCLMHASLQRSVEDLRELRSKLGGPMQHSDPKLQRVWRRLKYPFHESTVKRISVRMDKHIAMVNSVLSLIGRHNDLAVMRSIDRGVQLHTQTHTSLVTTVQQVESGIHARFDEIQSKAPTHVGSPIIIQSGSAADAAMALQMIHKHLSPALRGMLTENTPAASFDWMESQLNSLLAGSHELAAEEMRFGTRSRDLSRSRRRPAQPLAVQVLYHMGACGRQSDTAVIPKPASGRKDLELCLDLSIGRVYLTISRDPPTALESATGRLEGFCFQYIPKPSEYGVSGVAAAFMRPSGSGSTISPVLSTFGVLSYDSPVFDAIWSRDVIAVQRMLSERQFSPRDRDEYGDSLLYHAMRDFDFDMCQLLLREGADPMWCSANGDSALLSFVADTDICASDKYPQGDAALEILRLLIEHCGVYVYTNALWHQYNCVHDNEKGAVSSFVAFHQGARFDQDILRFMAYHFDLEERDCYGMTPLLDAANSVQWTDFALVIGSFLDAGSEPRAVDFQGRGVLHFILQDLSACNPHDIDTQTAQDIVQVGSELIKAGAEPTLPNCVRWTPTDNALAPAAWVLWLETLARAERDIEDILRKGDVEHGLESPRFMEIGEFIGDPTQPRVVSQNIFDGKFSDGNFFCDRCGKNEASEIWRFPFDIFSGFMRGERDCRHRMVTHHTDGYHCKNYLDPGSCTHHGHGTVHDIEVPGTTANGLSIRKWAAYRLWSDGYLSTPKEAHEWATTVITQDALDSWGHLALVRTNLFE